MSGLQVVSYSELTTHHRCSFKHQVAYGERWSKKPAAMSALGKGSAWHLVMEEHYLEIQACQRAGVISTEEILERCRKRTAPVIAELDDELGDLIGWMYSGYVAYWGTDPDWDILGVEHAAEVALPRPDGSDSEFRLKVKIDLVVRERSTRRVRIVDHKSGKDLPRRRALEIEDQFPLYHWAMQRLGKKVFGYTWNAARALKLVAEEKEPGTTPLDERFSREPMHRTDKEMQQIAVEAYLSARATYRELADCKELGVDAPRTTDALRCFWDCDFYAACLAGRKGMDWRDMLHRQGFEQSFERHLRVVVSCATMRNMDRRKCDGCDRPALPRRKLCARCKTKAWRDANPGKANSYASEHRRRRRREVIALYGGRCQCCGETEETFLTFDHVNGLEGPRMGSYAMYLDAEQRFGDGYYQVLCFNCNSGRQINGGVCPHEAKRH